MRSENARATSARPDTRPDAGRSGAARAGSGRPRPGRRPAGQRRGAGRPGSRPAGAARRPAQPQPSELERALAAAQATPAPEATTFRALGLPGPLVSALAEQGIAEPFAIQARALPDALAGRDVLGRAQTGSGKTLAFGLPLLAGLAGAGPAVARAPRGLILVPTRELAKQVAGVLEPLGRPLGVSVTTVYGGASMNVQISRLQRGVDIVVATPGRLIDLLDRGACTLGRIEATVLDEADHMADLGFLPAVTRILGETPAGGQRLLFSATLDRDVERLVGTYLHEPALHAVAPVTDVATAADHQVFVLPAADKFAIAAELAGRPDRTLFFVRTKHGADRLARQLTKAGVPASAIHGNLNQNQRHRALASFTEGNPRVLVATDVAARGLHIDDVGLVVHFDPPHDHKDYLHRSGRTARAGATGTVVALVDPTQVSDVAKMHDAAGITPSSHEVEAGHPAVREVATAGTPIPPPPPRPALAAAATRRPARSGGRPAHRRAAGDRAPAVRKPRNPGPDRPARQERPAWEERPARQDRQAGEDRPARENRPARSAGWSDRPARPARSADWEDRPARTGRPGRGGEGSRAGAAPGWDHGRDQAHGRGHGTGGSQGRTGGTRYAGRGGAQQGARDQGGTGRPFSGTGRPGGSTRQPSRPGRPSRSRPGFRQAG